MAALELTVTVLDQHAVRAQTPTGREAASRIELTKWHRELIAVFQHWLAEDKISRREELEVLGSLLYRTLFSGPIGSIYEELRREVPPNERLRVQLSFHSEAGDMASFPWEFLYVPDTETSAGYFIAAERDLVLSRYMPLYSDRQKLAPGESPLRLLIVTSRPTDLDTILVDPVIEAIEGLSAENPIQVEILEKPTVGNFLYRIEDTNPHILHFIGHGRYDEVDKRGYIALLRDDERSAEWVPDELFAEYFRQMRAIPRLVFLHSCEGGAIDFTAKFAGLAPQLIRADIQATVAMQYPVSNRVAVDFSRDFYAEIARGAPIDYAVQAGRWRIMTRHAINYNNRVFGTPVLYMRSYDGIILPGQNATLEG